MRRIEPCPQCGAHYLPEEVQGLCPRCLCRMLLQLDADEADAKPNAGGPMKVILKKRTTERQDAISSRTSHQYLTGNS